MREEQVEMQPPSGEMLEYCLGLVTCCFATPSVWTVIGGISGISIWFGEAGCMLSSIVKTEEKY